MPISAETYARVAMEDADAQWELVCGALRRKPPMTTRHTLLIVVLHEVLFNLLDRAQFAVHVNLSRLRSPGGEFYIPDLIVMPRDVQRRAGMEQPDQLDAYAEPMPLVVEVWSPSTGRRDLTLKLNAYRARGDREIWSLHPRHYTLTAWHRQPDGSYTETLYRGAAMVAPASLPGVQLELAALFAGRDQ